MNLISAVPSTTLIEYVSFVFSVFSAEFMTRNANLVLNQSEMEFLVLLG